MQRKRYEWKCRDQVFFLGEQTLLSGAIVIAPDTAAGQVRYVDPDRAFVRAVELQDAGVDLLSFAAEPLEAGVARVTEAEELRRLIPVLKRLKGKVTVPVCVVTYKAPVAEKALEHGAVAIQDPSCLTFDLDLAQVCSKMNAGLILQHLRGDPGSWSRLGTMKDPASVVPQELAAAVHRATRAGVSRQSLLLDPGLGQGKRKEQNLELVARMDRMAALEIPLHVSFANRDLLAPKDNTQAAVAAAAVASVLRGAHVVCAQDIDSLRPAILVADQMHALTEAEPPAPKAPPMPPTTRPRLRPL